MGCEINHPEGPVADHLIHYILRFILGLLSLLTGCSCCGGFLL
jgi:hypothetical protein